MDKELLLISEIIQWLSEKMPSLEKLRIQNIRDTSTMMYSTLGKNLTSKGNCELSPEHRLISNVQKGKLRSFAPKAARGYFEYFLDKVDNLLCSKRVYADGLRQYEQDEDHFLQKWNEEVSIYGLFSRCANCEPTCDWLTVYVRKDQVLSSRISINTNCQPFSFNLQYYTYAKDSILQMISEYQFIPVTKGQFVPAHMIRTVGKTDYSFIYREIR